MARKPFLGICYGMQFANALAGGLIHADSQAQANAQPHSPARGRSEHEIAIAPGSRLNAIFGKARLQTNSHHIQSIARVGAGLSVSARSSDGVIEALESPDGRIMAVQFHPERMADRGLPLFAQLLRRARG